MRRTIWIGAAAVALAASSAVVAQTTKAPAYDLRNEVELSGRISSLETIPDWMGKDGVNLKLRGPEGVTTVASHVDLSTARFLQMLDFPLAVGDDVKLLGSWGTAADGTPVFLVHAVTKQKVSLYLRDPRGEPLW